MRLRANRLRLIFAGGAEHEHRVGPITRQAIDLLRVRLRDELPTSGARFATLTLATLAVPPLLLDLCTLTDRAVAEWVSDAMFTAIRAAAGGQREPPRASSSEGGEHRQHRGEGK